MMTGGRDRSCSTCTVGKIGRGDVGEGMVGWKLRGLEGWIAACPSKGESLERSRAEGGFLGWGKDYGLLEIAGVLGYGH